MHNLSSQKKLKYFNDKKNFLQLFDLLLCTFSEILLINAHKTYDYLKQIFCLGIYCEYCDFSCRLYNHISPTFNFQTVLEANVSAASHGLKRVRFDDLRIFVLDGIYSYEENYSVKIVTSKPDLFLG